MHKIFCFLLLTVLLGCLQSCSDFLLQDISQEKVRLKNPVDGAVLANPSITFTWDTIDNAEYYRIQIVSPSFDSSLIAFKDFETTSNFFDLDNIPDGIYEWSVIAYNQGYQSIPNIRKLIVQSDSSSLFFQKINAIRPLSNAYISDSIVSFLWEKNSSSLRYRVQIATPDFTNPVFVILDTLIDNEYFLSALPEGKITWRVRGEDDIRFTQFTQKQFYTDRTKPNIPVLLLPLGNALVLSDSVQFHWRHDMDVLIDSLEVYKDSSLTQLEFSTRISDTSYIWVGNTILQDDYYWRVMSIDSAKNASSFSTIRKFFY